jgi:aspartate carbamoyltransferase regulatory subunit
MLEQVKARYSKLYEAMLNSNIDNFEVSYEKSVSDFKSLENLEKIRHTNCPDPAALPVKNEKSLTSSVEKSSKHHKYSKMRCHYCDNNNHNKNDCKAIAKLKQKKKVAFRLNMDPERSLWPSFSFLKKSIQSKAGCN